MSLIEKNIGRRSLFKGLGLGAATVATVSLMSGCKNKAQTADSPALVDVSAADYVIDPNTNDSLYEYKSTAYKPVSSWSFSLGTVFHPAQSQWSASTVAGSSASPMIKAGALSLASGKLIELVDKPLNKDANNVVIFDSACSDVVYAWLELSVLDHSWSLYAQAFQNGALSGDPKQLWQAGSDYDPAKFCVYKNKVIWQVMPSLSGNKTSEHSYCYLWHLGDSKAQSVIESAGRFATGPAVSGNTISLSPRVNADEGLYYAIAAYSLDDDLSTRVDQIVLPQSIKPFSALRIGDKFAFSIEANYSSGGLLGRMGTYIGDSSQKFVALSREPSAPVAGKDKLYVVKSNASYFVINTDEKSYSIISAANRCVDYGEYPAVMGECDSFYSFATIKDQATGKPSEVLMRGFSL